MPDSTDSKLVLESRLEEVNRAEAAVLVTLKTCGFDAADRFAIKLALEEALANAIKHGNESDASKSVTVEWTAAAGEVRITVTDEGPGFTPDDVPDPTLDENLTKPSGRGVMLMRAYMDEVSFNDSGNRVTLVKRPSNAAANRE